MFAKLVLASLLAVVACNASQLTTQPSSDPSPTDTASLAQYLPDPNITPGDADPNADVCHAPLTPRPDLSQIKRQQMTQYHRSGTTRDYEEDHLIPRELGGRDVARNLWPMPWNGPYNARMKDRLENTLKDDVCHYGLPLATAQHEIATNWVQSYQLRVVQGVRT